MSSKKILILVIVIFVAIDLVFVVLWWQKRQSEKESIGQDQGAADQSGQALSPEERMEEQTGILETLDAGNPPDTAAEERTEEMMHTLQQLDSQPASENVNQAEEPSPGGESQADPDEEERVKQMEAILEELDTRQ